MELLIAAWLLPVPFGEREVCCKSERHAFKGPRLLQPIAGIVQCLHKQQPTVRETPWYCRVPYTTVQQLYINLVKLIINRFFACFGFVCFLDVFVTFFTGQYDKCSGLLKSKPFFQRWIMPGLALQLLGKRPKCQSYNNFFPSTSHARPQSTPKWHPSRHYWEISLETWPTEIFSGSCDGQLLSSSHWLSGPLQGFVISGKDSSDDKTAPVALKLVLVLVTEAGESASRRSRCHFLGELNH